MLDLVLYNGRVLTQTAPPVAAAVGVRDGRIVAVGRRRGRAARRPVRRDAPDRSRRPNARSGLQRRARAHLEDRPSADDHARPAAASGASTSWSTRASASRQPLPEGAWLLGRGYNEAAMSERRPPTRADLDRAAPNRPVVLTRTCGHIYAVNSGALERAGIGPETQAPVGGVIEHDEHGRAERPAARNRDGADQPASCRRRAPTTTRR